MIAIFTISLQDISFICSSTSLYLINLSNFAGSCKLFLSLHIYYCNSIKCFKISYRNLALLCLLILFLRHCLLNQYLKSIVEERMCVIKHILSLFCMQHHRTRFILQNNSCLIFQQHYQ